MGRQKSVSVGMELPYDPNPHTNINPYRKRGLNILFFILNTSTILGTHYIASSSLAVYYNPALRAGISIYA